ncbi:MAG: hypothetical protein D3912_04170 [Candidatus Electrothrix sp. AX1]|nr:hypothetical protein [Candidatus Electrothrix sp. AX1]
MCCSASRETFFFNRKEFMIVLYQELCHSNLFLLKNKKQYKKLYNFTRVYKKEPYQVIIKKRITKKLLRFGDKKRHYGDKILTLKQNVKNSYQGQQGNNINLFFKYNRTKKLHDFAKVYKKEPCQVFFN